MNLKLTCPNCSFDQSIDEWTKGKKWIGEKEGKKELEDPNVICPACKDHYSFESLLEFNIEKVEIFKKNSKEFQFFNETMTKIENNEKKINELNLKAENLKKKIR
jgi:Zn ribbon nucleic-acid-binding protein